MRIVLTGGGSGGHLLPLVAVAEKLNQKFTPASLPDGTQDSLELFYVGPRIQNEEIISEFSTQHINLAYISGGKMRRYFSWQNFIDPFKFIWGIAQTFWIMFHLMPDAVFAKGGFGSVPVCFVGWLFRIPVLIHESDSVPGLANRINRFFAKRIGLAFAQAAKSFPAKKTAVVGNPIRDEILAGTPAGANALFHFAVASNPVVLVLGGSQGSEAINDLVFSGLPQLLTRYEIIHQTGSHDFQELRNETKAELSDALRASYHEYEFISGHDLAQAYAAASVIVSRAGAGSIFEIAAVGKPSIIIPLPGSASDHQRENAYAYASSGAAIVLEQQNLTYHMLFENIERITLNQKVHQKMSEATKTFAAPQSAQLLADALLEMGKR